MLGAIATTSFGQETVERSNDLSLDIAEHYAVLKDNKKTRHGLYQVFRDGKVLLATGRYNHGNRVGIWRFNDNQRILTQRYDYTNKKLLYNRIADTVMVNFDYGVKVSPGDTLTYPIKIGGIKYGYFNLTNGRVDKLERDIHNMGTSVTTYRTFRIFTIGADGLINKYQVLLEIGKSKKIYDVDLNTLSDDDKSFVPATLNGKPIVATGYFEVDTTRGG